MTKLLLDSGQQEAFYGIFLFLESPYPVAEDLKTSLLRHLLRHTEMPSVLAHVYYFSRENSHFVDVSPCTTTLGSPKTAVV
jgi:hypothetical protein